VKVIVKLETKDALDNLENIIIASDGLSLVKGSLEELGAKKSLTEEKVITMCNKLGKPFILAANYMNLSKTTSSQV